MASNGRRKKIATACCVLWALLGSYGAAKAAPPASPNVLLSKRADVDGFLTDASGRSLYVFLRDAVSGESTCSGDCAKKWSPFFVEKAVPERGIQPLFREAQREDGRKQLAFRHYPLYYFSGDEKPGDIKGDGVDEVWFLAKAPFYTVMLAKHPELGVFFVGPEGRTLYASASDPKGESACTGDCSKRWPPFFASPLILPRGLSARDFGTVVRADGQKQLAYKGHALYWHARDLKPNDANGLGKEGWMLADPAKLQ